MKQVKLYCSHSDIPSFFEEQKLYKGKLDEERGVIMVKCRYGVVFDINADSMVLHGENGKSEPGVVRFVKLKTKTIKCTSVRHDLSGKKHFKAGKRYQVDLSRSVGSNAGYVFDEDGDRWQLYREEVGFQCGGGTYLFEALYS